MNFLKDIGDFFFCNPIFSSLASADCPHNHPRHSILLRLNAHVDTIWTFIKDANASLPGRSVFNNQVYLAITLVSFVVLTGHYAWDYLTRESAPNAADDDADSVHVSDLYPPDELNRNGDQLEGDDLSLCRPEPGLDSGRIYVFSDNIEGFREDMTSGEDPVGYDDSSDTDDSSSTEESLDSEEVYQADQKASSSLNLEQEANNRKKKKCAPLAPNVQ